MPFPRLLLLSNSTIAGTEYLRFAQTPINNFLTPDVKQVLFIPFAVVSFSWDLYQEKVQNGLPQYKIVSIHQTADYLSSVANAEAICVGGGNTFHLLYYLQKFGLIDAIRRRVLDDNVPYIGWSAGSNVAAPDIATTNDMPIIWPQFDSAFNLVPFNVNPHYNAWKPDGYQGEGRDDRLNECIAVRKRPIVAISEGLAIVVEAGKHYIIAPDLGSIQCSRCAKIWLPNSSQPNGYEVRELVFGQDITPLIS